MIATICLGSPSIKKQAQSPTWAFLINKWGFYCRKEVYPIKLLAKEAAWQPPLKQPRLLRRLLIVRHKLTEDRTYISRWTQTCQAGGYLEPLPLQTWALKVLFMLPKKRCEHKSSYKSFNLQQWPACKIHWYKSDTELMGGTNQYLIGFRAHFMKWDLDQHCLCGQAKTWD